MSSPNTQNSQHNSLPTHSELHLMEDQFTDCLLGGEPTAKVAAHLAHCDSCREELASFGGSVASFNTAALAWSESRPAPSLREASRVYAQRPFLIASWALAACTLLVVGGSTMLHRQSSEHAAAIASVGSTQDQFESEAQIAQDNKLLLEVDQAISSSDRSPIQEYGLSETPGTRRRTPGKARIQ